MGAPAPDLGDLGPADLLDADVLPAVRDIRPAGDFPLAHLVAEPITKLELHWEDAGCDGRGCRSVLGISLLAEPLKQFTAAAGVE
jgi:hypothetical protein